MMIKYIKCENSKKENKTNNLINIHYHYREIIFQLIKY